MEVYENLGEKVGKASQSSQRSACNKFDKFLSELQTIDSHSCPHTTLAEFSDDELGRFQNIFGRFPSFMLKDKLSMNTALHYLSQVHCFIRKRNRGSDIFYPEWYSHLNTQLENMYNKHASDTNTCIANSAPPMTESELHTLCKMLFARGTLVSSSQRSLLVLQWQALGRVSDITNMPMSRIDWYSNFDCLQLLMHRPKTNTDHPITVFLHSSDWLLCPLHALAMQIAFCSSSSERLFPLVPLNNPAQHLPRRRQLPPTPPPTPMSALRHCPLQEISLLTTRPLSLWSTTHTHTSTKKKSSTFVLLQEVCQTLASWLKGC
jgi:hypothetical protein